MKPAALFYFARVKPMTAWSISGSLLGIALAGYLSNWHIVDVVPTILAAAVVIMMQYVAHPMNDLTDYDIDRQAPIGETGRVKPLVDGMITHREARFLTVSMVIAVLAILSYLIWLHPVLILPASYGVAALIGYNHRSTKLAYRPYSELYLSMPLNAISVFVISYIGSGKLSLVAAVVAIAFGFACSSFFVSMMSMDFPTDSKNGKRTTIVAHPRLWWCAYYPLIGLAIAWASAPFLDGYFGHLPTAAFLVTTTLVFISLAVLGASVDALRMDYLAGKLSRLEGLTGKGRMEQLYLSIGYALSLTVMLAYLGM